MWDLLLSAVMALTATAAEPQRLEPPSSLADLPRGEPPRVGYVDHGVWRGPHGRAVDLPDSHGISSITPYHGGFLMTDTRYFEGTVGLMRLDREGRALETYPSAGLARAADGSVAWTSFTVPEAKGNRPSLIHVIAADGSSRTLPWDGLVPFYVAGFVGDQVLAARSFVGPVVLVDCDGSTDRIARLTGASSVSGTLVAGAFERGRGVIDVATGDVLWRARGYGLVFSPSGRRVAMTDRDSVVVRRTSDGAVAWRHDLLGYVDRLVWEDRGHLLGVAGRRGRTAILRLDRTGVERAFSDRA